MGKEPWDSSSDKAKSLKREDFGTPEEVWNAAKPVRTAKDRRSVCEILKEIAEKGTIISRSGMKARISGKTVGKIISSKAITASFNEESHYLAAANIDWLFKKQECRYVNRS